jgi:hypothetical protein
VVRQWGAGFISSPHGIQADASSPSNLWVTDVGSPLGPTVKQFSNDGQLLAPVLGTAGTAGSGLAPIQFSVPADVALVPPTTVVVSDGDGGFNNRVVSLDASTGTVQWVTGGNGTGPGQVGAVLGALRIPSTRLLWSASACVRSSGLCAGCTRSVCSRLLALCAWIRIW